MGNIENEKNLFFATTRPSYRVIQQIIKRPGAISGIHGVPDVLVQLLAGPAVEVGGPIDKRRRKLHTSGDEPQALGVDGAVEEQTITDNNHELSEEEALQVERVAMGGVTHVHEVIDHGRVGDSAGCHALLGGQLLAPQLKRRRTAHGAREHPLQRTHLCASGVRNTSGGQHASEHQKKVAGVGMSVTSWAFAQHGTRTN